MAEATGINCSELDWNPALFNSEFEILSRSDDAAKRFVRGPGFAAGANENLFSAKFSGRAFDRIQRSRPAVLAEDRLDGPLPGSTGCVE